MTEQEILQIARKRADAKLGFYIHLSVYVLVMILLFAINYLSAAHPWSLYPFLGWGLGVAIHGFVSVGVVGSGFREQLLQAEISKLKSQQSTNA